MYKKFSTFSLKNPRLKKIIIDQNIFSSLLDFKRPVASKFIGKIKIMALDRINFMERVKIELAASCKIVYTNSISFYLGLKVYRKGVKRMIKLHEPVYIKKVLRLFFFNQVNQRNNSIKKSVQLLHNSNKTAIKSEQEKYH